MYIPISGLNYAFFEKSKDKNHIYSIDKVVLAFNLNAYQVDRLAFAITSFAVPVVNEKSWITNKIGSFKYQHTFECDGGGSFWVGIGLNEGGKTNIGKARIEFNPNKLWYDEGLQYVLAAIRKHSKDGLKLVRWDLAVDVPILRESLELLKDKRLYEEVRHSYSNRTQYIGARNKSGRAKLYNKALEQSLDSPLSRIELTLSAEDSTAIRAAALFPRVQDMSGGGMVAAQTDTDNFILRTLIAEPERIGELSRKKREKMQQLLDGANFFLDFDIKAYKAIYTTLQRKILQG